MTEEGIQCPALVLYAYITLTCTTHIHHAHNTHIKKKAKKVKAVSWRVGSSRVNRLTALLDENVEANVEL